MLLTDYHAPSDGSGSELAPTDCLLLRFDQRCRSRFGAVTTTQQKSINVLLPRGIVIRHGGLLTNAAGDCLEVIAADETLLRVRATDPHALLRAAYHLGNRHVKLEVRPEYLQLELDPVLKEMLLRLGGLTVETVETIFEPEVGAYGGGHHHGHDETFAEDYASAQAAYRHHHGAT
jgi:urease accessory protein